MKSAPVLPILAIAVATPLAGLMPFLGASSYASALIYYAAYYLALGQAWNMMSGLTGYVSFANGALAGVGAYACVIVMNGEYGVVAGLGAGAATSMIASLLIGVTSLRLRGVAFTFATLFFQELALLVTRKLPFAGGAGGLSLDTMPPLWLPHVLMVGIAASATFAVLFLRRSRIGVRLLAIKGDEDAATAIGIDANRMKLAVFCASAAICGLAGATHALFTASLYPDTVFQVDLSLVALAIPLIGGVGTAFGPVVGSALYVGARELLQIAAPALHLTVIGLLILLVTLFLPAGLGPATMRLWRPFLWRSSRSAPRETTS
jgi:branched-chain amino acid transport system permease protein